MKVIYDLNDREIKTSSKVNFKPKKRPDEKVMKFLMKQQERLGKDMNPADIDYGHLPFDAQFTDYGIRGLEIDIYNDPNGGAFYKRKINGFVKGVPKKSGVKEMI